MRLRLPRASQYASGAVSLLPFCPYPTPLFHPTQAATAQIILAGRPSSLAYSYRRRWSTSRRSGVWDVTDHSLLLHIPQLASRDKSSVTVVCIDSMCPGPAPARASIPPRAHCCLHRANGYRRLCVDIGAWRGVRAARGTPYAPAPCYQQQHGDRVAELVASVHTLLLCPPSLRARRITDDERVQVDGAALQDCTRRNAGPDEFKPACQRFRFRGRQVCAKAWSVRAQDADARSRQASKPAVGVGTGCAFAIRDPRDDFGDSKEGDATMEYKQTAIYFGLPHRLCAASKSTLHRRS
ncbi:hypothetical protein DFH09DRAFT_1386197 [Mycena vulgaris]|nr:hypothetical protein DFH09DRAFT_1386197 [Mycena vulgaris]